MTGWTPERRAIALDRKLTMTQAARRLGVSRSAVAGQRHREAFPYVPVGKVRFKRPPFRLTGMTITLDDDTWTEIKDYAARVGAPNRTAAIRDLIEWGLELASEVPEDT